MSTRPGRLVATKSMFHSIASGTASDHILISCIAREAEIFNSLRRNLPNVIAVHVPTVTSGALMAIVQMKKTAEGQRNRRSWRLRHRNLLQDRRGRRR
jgi:UbiD family decarboxylase